MVTDITDRVAIITGAGCGTGATIAHILAQAGLRVAVNDINPDRAERLAQQIRASGGRALGLAADVANKFQCVKLIEAVRAEWGQLDILVNGAAIEPSRPILTLDEWEFQRCMDVNLKGTFFMCQLCGRVMRDENEARGGVIINLVDTAEGETGHTAYCTSQAAVVAFSRACAREYAPYGLRVHTLERHQPALAEQVWQLCAPSP